MAFESHLGPALDVQDEAVAVIVAAATPSGHACPASLRKQPRYNS